MKAAVLKEPGAPLVVEDAATPSIGERDILVRVEASGVCHTDLHLAEGLLCSVGHDPFPLIPGHEIAGIVEQTGSSVEQVVEGDRVGAYMWCMCGHCEYCRADEEEVCPSATSEMRAIGITSNGGYAEYAKVPADQVIALPDELDCAAAAPFFCAGLTMYAAFKNAGLRAGQKAAVIGIGGLGHLGVQIACALGAEVIAITTSHEKVELAKQLGAHCVLSASDGDVGAQLREAGGANVVVSTTLDFQSIRSVMRGILPLGALVITGLQPGRLLLDPRDFVLKQQRVIGSYFGSRSDMQQMLQLAVRHKIRPIVETFGLDAVNDVHERLKSNQVRFRAVLTPNG